MTTLPTYNEMHWPTVIALRSLGGSGNIEEINDAVITQMGFTDEQQEVLHGNGPGTKIVYMLAWARSYLKGMGLAENSERGVWNLTELGRTVQEDQILPLRQEYLKQSQEKRQARCEEGHPDDEPDEVGGLDVEPTWQESLLALLMGIPPDAFERLAQRLLREAGFVNTQVLGKSGDGGVDGVGMYRLSLISFPVYFQCKRYKGSVGSGAVRDFRGAMVGRGDKGLLITTGTFTADAKAEAARDGAPPIDLIDGERLASLLKKYQIGVKVETRQVEDVTLIPAYFEGL